MKRSYAAASVFTVLIVCSQSLLARTWTDRSGKHKVEAELAEVTKTHVVLVRSDGRQARLAINRLSQSDVAYVRQWVKAQAAKSSGFDDQQVAANVKCRVSGSDFDPDAVVLTNGILTFKQGDGFFPDSEIKLFLFADDGVSGKKFSVNSRKRTFGVSPHVHVTWMKDGKRDTEIVMSNYDLTLQFGPRKGNTVAGTIVLKVPKYDCSANGSFVATLPRDYAQPPTTEDVPHVVGRIVLRGAKEANLYAGYRGFKSDGKYTTNGAGTKLTIGDTQARVTSTTHKPRTTTLYAKGGDFLCHHLQLEPSICFFYVRANSHYITGEWIGIHESTSHNMEFDVDLSNVGSLTVSQADNARQVYVMPLGADGNAVPSNLLQQWQKSGVAITSKADENGKAVFQPMHPGWYSVRAGKAMQKVEVKPNQDSRVDLAAR